MDTKSFSNKTKDDNSKSKKGRVVILVRDTSSGPVLHFYQVSSKYSKGYSSYRADKKFYAEGIHPKNNRGHNFRMSATSGEGAGSPGVYYKSAFSVKNQHKSFTICT